jgi:predicted amidohydrolase
MIDCSLVIADDLDFPLPADIQTPPAPEVKLLYRYEGIITHGKKN